MKHAFIIAFLAVLTTTPIVARSPAPITTPTPNPVAIVVIVVCLVPA